MSTKMLVLNKWLITITLKLKSLINKATGFTYIFDLKNQFCEKNAKQKKIWDYLLQ